MKYKIPLLVILGSLLVMGASIIFFINPNSYGIAGGMFVLGALILLGWLREDQNSTGER